MEAYRLALSSNAINGRILDNIEQAVTDLVQKASTAGPAIFRARSLSSKECEELWLMCMMLWVSNSFLGISSM